MGAIKKDDIRHHPRNNVITNALGTEIGMEKINCYEVSITKNDVFLLCSDGVSDLISDNELEEILNSNKSLDKSGSSIVERANHYGGKDNITAILIKV